MKKVVMKGTVPVDQQFFRASTYKVYSDSSTVYSKTLNQSSIKDNHNKFYIIQILVGEQNPNSSILFTRWGRVGVPGQKAEENYPSIDRCVGAYHKKLNEKLRKSYREV